MFPIRVKTVQESDLRMLGSLARNIQRVLPVTQADIDAAAALGEGWVVWKVFEVSDPLDNLRGGTQLIIRQNSIQPGQNVRRVIFVSGPGGQTVVIRGTDYIVLPDAIAHSLSYVKAFGGTEQNGTPTPDNPVQIISNNGVVKFSLNEFDPNAVELGYYRNTSTGTKTESPYNFLTAMMPVKPNTSYVLFGRRKSDNRLSAYNRIYWFDSNQDFISTSSYSVNTVTIATSPANAAYAQGGINESGGTSIPTTQEIVDDYNWVFQQGTAEMSYTPYSPTGIYTDGTVETIEDIIGNTATAEMLLKVGDYQDEQEILSGVVTRKVGIKVFDGTEGWVKGTSFYADISLGALQAAHSCICNYYAGKSTNPYSADSNTIQVGYNDGSLIFWNRVYITANRAEYATAADFKAYLAAQYNAGTPVIVIYPLATPTTESVTGQTLQVTDGDNTLEITQASLNGLELEAEYNAAVSLTIQEVEDANLDNNVTVTIQ